MSGNKSNKSANGFPPENIHQVTLNSLSKLPLAFRVIRFFVDNFQGTGKRTPADLTLYTNLEDNEKKVEDIKHTHVRLITIGVRLISFY